MNMESDNISQSQRKGLFSGEKGPIIWQENLLGKKSQSGIVLTLFVEVVGKELLKNIRWWYMTDEHGKR